MDTGAFFGSKNDAKSTHFLHRKTRLVWLPTQCAAGLVTNAMHVSPRLATKSWLAGTHHHGHHHASSAAVGPLSPPLACSLGSKASDESCLGGLKRFHLAPRRSRERRVNDARRSPLAHHDGAKVVSVIRNARGRGAAGRDPPGGPRGGRRRPASSPS